MAWLLEKGAKIKRSILEKFGPIVLESIEGLNPNLQEVKFFEEIEKMIEF